MERDFKYSLSFISSSPSETINFGEFLGRILKSPAFLALKGNLGTGKTLLTKGVAKAKGIKEEDVVSPTFVILNVYKTPKEIICHLDCYRIKDEEDLADLGLDQLLQRKDVLVIIEWAEKIINALPKENTTVVELEFSNDDLKRKISIYSNDSKFIEKIKDFLRKE